jgi:hypothetical protein
VVVVGIDVVAANVVDVVAVAVEVELQVVVGLSIVVFDVVSVGVFLM